MTDLLHRLRDAVAAHPERTAVLAGAARLDFAELDLRTAALARALRAHGVGRGDRVGVHLARTADLPVALLAVWRAAPPTSRSTRPTPPSGWPSWPPTRGSRP